MGLGKTIAQIAKEQGRSITWLAKQTDISINTMYAIIRRDSNYIGYSDIKKIAQALGVKSTTLVLCGADAVKQEYYKRIGLV